MKEAALRVGLLQQTEALFAANVQRLVKDVRDLAEGPLQALYLVAHLRPVSLQ